MNKEYATPKMQFDTISQQVEANTLGMWAFIATEILFFGALLLTYSMYRWFHSQTFSDASQELNLTAATINTVLLISSSASIALADWTAEKGGSTRRIRGLLIVTCLLGFAFLIIKGCEYKQEYAHGLVPFADKSFEWFKADVNGAKLFFNLYFIMTGLHALHLTIGCGLVLYAFSSIKYRNVHTHEMLRMMALYWHFVDVVWVWLFPLFYLVR